MMARKNLDMQLAIYGYDAIRSDIAWSYNNLAWIYRDRGKLKEAEAMSQKSLDMHLAIHGDDGINLAIAVSHGTMAAILEKQGHVEAIEYATSSLNMLRSVHQKNLEHPYVVKIDKILDDILDKILDKQLCLRGTRA